MENENTNPEGVPAGETSAPENTEQAQGEQAAPEQPVEPSTEGAPAAEDGAPVAPEGEQAV